MQGISTESVHEALLALYVPAELATCELAGRLPASRDLEDVVERAQAVRGRLLDAIELLRPASHTAPSASASRAYDCLRLRYVSGFRVEDIARQLALSPRQVYRDLGWAEEQLARVVQSQCERVTAPKSLPEGAGALETEIQALARNPQAADLYALVESALATISPLAMKHGATVELTPPARPVKVVVTAAVVREVVTLLLSALVQSGASQPIVVEIGTQGREGTVSLPMAKPQEMARYDLVQVALQAAQRQQLEYEHIPGDEGRLVIRLPLAKQRRVLIVDDNPGASALYDRYLASTEWDPLRAPHARLAVDMAVSEQADAVILDVMMAEADGWTILRALRRDPRTRDIPIVMCSVVNDPDLGLTLGASAYLTKPVSRLRLLEALRQSAREERPASGASSTTRRA